MQGESFDDFKRKMNPADASDPECLSLSQMDGQYSKLRPSNKMLECLHVVDIKGEVVTLNYAFLDVRADFKPGEFTVIFAGTKHFRVTVTGNNLWRIFNYVCSRRWAYLRVEPRRFEDKEEAITSIDIQDITPKSD